MNIEENTKKTPIFGTYQKNEDALVVYNQKESYLIIIQHYLGLNYIPIPVIRTGLISFQ